MATITIRHAKTARDGTRYSCATDSEDGLSRGARRGRSRPNGGEGAAGPRRRRDRRTGGTQPTARALAQVATAPIDQPLDWARFLESRIDVDANTKKNYASALRKIGETFGDRDPSTITATEIAEWIATLAETRKPGTLGQYLIAFRLLLDHVGVEPNVARDPRVKLPKQVREEPTAAVEGALRGDHGGARRRSGSCCSSPSSRVRSGSARRSGSGGPTSMQRVCGSGCRGPRRSVTVPAGCTCPQWLMEAIEDTCPLEDRVPERKVFQGITEASAYQAMSGRAGTRRCPHYHPHDLRHRRITIWHQSGVPARELAERAGHARPSMSLDVY